MEATDTEKQAILNALNNPESEPEPGIRDIVELIRKAMDMTGSGKLREYLGIDIQEVFPDFIPQSPGENALLALSKIYQISPFLKDTRDTKNQKGNLVKVGKGLSVPVQIDFPESAKPALRKLSEWDKVIENTCGNIWKWGKQKNKQKVIYVNERTIWQAITGNPEARVPAGMAKKISDSMKKLSQVRIEFSHDWEIKGKPCTITIEGQIVSTSRVSVTMKRNGKTMNVWKLLEKPRLFHYSEQIGQVLQIPREALATEGRTDEGDIILRRYLLQQLGRIRGTNNSGTGKILVSSIPDVKDKNKQPDKWKRRRIVQNVEAVLSDLERLGMIQKWTQIKDGRTVEGWTVETSAT